MLQLQYLLVYIQLKGCRKKKTNRDRGARDKEEGEGADCHCQTSCRSWGLQGSNSCRGYEASILDINKYNITEHLADSPHLTKYQLYDDNVYWVPAVWW